MWFEILNCQWHLWLCVRLSPNVGQYRVCSTAAQPSSSGASDPAPASLVRILRHNGLSAGIATVCSGCCPVHGDTNMPFPTPAANTRHAGKLEHRPLRRLMGRKLAIRESNAGSETGQSIPRAGVPGGEISPWCLSKCRGSHNCRRTITRVRQRCMSYNKVCLTINKVSWRIRITINSPYMCGQAGHTWCCSVYELRQCWSGMCLCKATYWWFRATMILSVYLSYRPWQLLFTSQLECDSVENITRPAQ